MLWLMTLASAAPVPPLAWDWSKPERFLVEVQVQLPMNERWRAERNHQVRVVGFQTRTVLECHKSERSTRRRDEILCTIEDFGLFAGTQPGDRGRAGPVLEEYDEVLTGATLRMRMAPDGRVTAVDIPSLEARNHRGRLRNQILAQILRFTAMGFDLGLPDGSGDLWLHDRALSCTVPSAVGTSARIEGVTRGVVRGDVVELAARSRGLMTAGDSANAYTCETTARAFFQPGRGLLQHSWEMLGEPTASSRIAVGAAGYPYTQAGGLRRLDPGEHPDVGPTAEIEVENGPSAIQIEESVDAR